MRISPEVPEELGDTRPTPTDAASVSAPHEAGTSDRTRTFRRLWGRVRLTATRTRLEYVFLVIALTWGVTQVFLVPPLQVPDEGVHWFRAWALTDGQLTADREGTLTLPPASVPRSTSTHAWSAASGACEPCRYLWKGKQASRATRTSSTAQGAPVP
jgi:hypothetical protein